MAFGAVALNEEPASPILYARAAQRDLLSVPGVAAVRPNLWRWLVGAPAVRVRVDGRGRLWIDANLVLHFGAPARQTGFLAVEAIRAALENICEKPIASLTVRIAGIALHRLDKEPL